MKPKAPPQPPTILTVDDDDLILRFLAEILTSVGYRVIAATSGEKALETILELEPDLAIIDVNMPGMNGLELAQKLRDETAVPFIFLSNQSDMDIIKAASQYGALGYLVKPTEAIQVISSVEAALARAADIKRLRNSEQSLTTALDSGRETSMAVGILMERLQIDRQLAFEKLRAEARSNRIKITHIANAVLLSVEAQKKAGQDG
jgi:response regulator NasT